MENSYFLILGFAVLTLVLLLGIAVVRLRTVYQKKHGLRFKVDGSDVSPLAQRLCRAHANCYENLPIVIAVILVAAMTGNLAVTNGLAFVFLGFRVAQSFIHVVSTSTAAIELRFVCYLIQCSVLVYWIVQLFML